MNNGQAQTCQADNPPHPERQATRVALRFGTSAAGELSGRAWGAAWRTVRSGRRSPRSRRANFWPPGTLGGARKYGLAPAMGRQTCSLTTPDYRCQDRLCRRSWLTHFVGQEALRLDFFAAMNDESGEFWWSRAVDCIQSSEHQSSRCSVRTHLPGRFSARWLAG